jgi:pyruvate,orthophosphate dikinase
MALAGTVVTVDGQSGIIYADAQELIIPDESGDDALAALIRWAQMYTPLRVQRYNETPAGEFLDLNDVNGGEDPSRLEEILKAAGGVKGARGGAIASDEGVRAAIAAGLEFIIAQPALPPLLAAVQSRGTA